MICPISKRFLRHPSLNSPPSSRLVSPSLPRLSGWQRQSQNPPQHTSEQALRQMALRLQQPVVAGMLYQPAPVFTSLCCKLVNDHVSIPFGSIRRRHRLPKL